MKKILFRLFLCVELSNIVMDSLSTNGFVMANNVDINNDNNWDDSAIVNVFEDAIRKHRTKVSDCGDAEVY